MEKSQDTSAMLLNPDHKRILAMAALSLGLSGCARFGGDAAALYQVAKIAWAGNSAVTLQEAAAVPYASIGVRLGNSNEVMLVLATDQYGQRLWTSSQRIVLVTDNGRVVRTSGLGNDLGGAYARTRDTSTHDTRKDDSAFTWFADFPNVSLYSVPVTCRPRPATDETILILGKQFQTVRIKEDCAADSNRLNWAYTNVFWRDPQNGFVWKSVQYFHPHADPLRIEILRAPSDN